MTVRSTGAGIQSPGLAQEEGHGKGEQRRAQTTAPRRGWGWGSHAPFQVPPSFSLFFEVMHF